MESVTSELCFLFTHKELSSCKCTRPTVGVSVVNRISGLCITLRAALNDCHHSGERPSIFVSLSNNNNNKRVRMTSAVSEQRLWKWAFCATFKMSPVPLNTHYRIETGRPQTGIVHKLWAYMSVRRLTHASSLKHTAQRLLGGSVCQSASSWYQWVWDGTHAAIKDSQSDNRKIHFLLSVFISKSSHPQWRRSHVWTCSRKAVTVKV